MWKNLPKILRLHLSTNCNLSCSYCYEDKTIPKNDISLKDFKKILEITKDVKIDKLYLYWWEPLLNKDIIDYLIELKKLPENIFSLWMTTNWTLLTKKIVNYLESINSKVNISVDSIKPKHNINRFFKKTKKWSFDIILKNLSHIKKKDNFTFTSTLSTNNYDSILEYIIYFRKLGFKRFSFNFLYEDNWDRYHFENLYKIVIMWKKIWLLKKENFYNELNYDNYLSCFEHMKKYLSITPKLEIIPCGYWWAKNVYKNKLFDLPKTVFSKDFDYFEYLDKNIINNKNIINYIKNDRICEFTYWKKFIINKKKISLLINKIFDKNTKW